MKRLVTCALAATICVGGAYAQAGTEKSSGVALSVGQTVEQAVAGMAKRAGAVVVVDPAITGDVSAATAKLPLEQGLSAIGQAQHAVWRKVYLKEAEIPVKTDKAIDVAKLKTMVEAASLAPKTTIGVVDPTTGEVAITTRTQATSPSTVEWLAARKAVYVLFRPATVGMGLSNDAVSDYLTTQKNSMETFRKMTPEQRSAATRQGIDMFLNMDPEVMGQMAMESMQAMQSLSTEQKAKLMDMSMKMMGQMKPPPPPPQ